MKKIKKIPQHKNHGIFNFIVGKKRKLSKNKIIKEKSSL